jgi:hypothetical protein
LRAFETEAVFGFPPSFCAVAAPGTFVTPAKIDQFLAPASDHLLFRRRGSRAGKSNC